ncbi:MAG: hypothetical protein ACK55O_12830 [Phycisphaerales bacterium]|jgi:tRNA A37 threonylcarbamoyladenosine modification protein TsaB|nr:hypothetical protein [Phycisphaeraceae bacterium]
MIAPGTLLLAIETSNPSAIADRGAAFGPGVAIGRIGSTGLEILHAEALRPVGRHEDDLATCIDRCVSAGVGSASANARAAIGLVVVSVGPGGYTALRMACASGQMIALANGARCVAVPTAGALAMSHVMHAAQTGGDARSLFPMAVALAGKGDTAHVTVFSDAAKVRDPAACAAGRVVGPSEVGAMRLATLIADGHVPAALTAAAGQAGAKVLPPAFDPRALLELVAGANAWPDADPASLVPLYAREPEAVTLWRARGGGNAASA